MRMFQPSSSHQYQNSSMNTVFACDVIQSSFISLGLLVQLVQDIAVAHARQVK